MWCISCDAALDPGVQKLAASLGASRVICAVCLSAYSERTETVQMNVRIPVDLDTELRESARAARVPYARVVRERLQRRGDS